MRKKVLALILVLSMLFSMLNTALAANVSDFSDMPDDWSRPALERAIANGLLSGTNGRINASGKLTRAEMASIVVRAFGANEKADLSAYSDVKTSDWFYADMQKAVAMGVLSGSNGKLNPTAPITREEVCAVLYRAFLLRDGGGAAQKFGDHAAISGWAQPAVAAMTAGGHVAGDAYGNVNPSKTITRAEFAQMMDNLVKSYPSGAVSGVIDGNAVVKSADVELAGAVVKGDLILADGLGKADIDLSDCVVEGRIIVRGADTVTLPDSESAERVVVAAVSGGELTLTGKAATVEVKADDMTIVAGKDAELAKIETAMRGTTIEGEGKVEAVEVQAGASKTKVTTNHTDIEVAENGGKVTSNYGTLSAGESGTTDSAGQLAQETASKPSSGSSGSGTSGTKKYDVTDAAGKAVGTFKKGTTLTIDPANGAASYTVTVNGKVTLETPDREGYTFAGWTVSGTAITAQWTKNEEPPVETVALSAADGTVISTFERGTELTIAPANGGESYTITMDSAKTLDTPTREGYTFTGWTVAGTTIAAGWRAESTADEGNQPYTKDTVALVTASSVPVIWIDAKGADYDGISLIADAIAGDIEAITGKKPQVVTEAPAEAETVILAGTVDDQLIQAQELEWDISASGGDYKSTQWERYQIQVVENNGQTRIVIAGADKRGTIYGMFYLTQDLCGVSPWIYWGDVQPKHQDTLTLRTEDLTTTADTPSVGYRGIFLNDESPSLTNFVKNQFGNCNYLFYANVYELVLRLKGNYLWPAMWSNNFSEDGILNIENAKDTSNADKLAEDERTIYANAILADHYGVVMGTSHHEPLYRAGVEWQRLQSKNTYTFDTEQDAAKNEWNYFLNSQNIDAFWTDGAERNKDYENVVTIGMRGEADSALTWPDGTKLSLQENINVLKSAITSQQKILADKNVTDPQLLVLYKEVEDFWYGQSGDEIASDNLKSWDALKNTIIMLCEDNQGNLRTLPKADERDRDWGMYYHFDYHGGPRSYEWINTVPLARVWDNMTTSYDYGVDDIWIVNVGDLKPMELPISYFLDLAYDFDEWGTSNPNSTEKYTRQWVEQQFGDAGLSEADLDGITDVLVGYTDMNGRHKSEIVSGSTYSIENYNEAQRMLEEAIALEELAETYLEKMPAAYKDAYWQLVYYPAAATANVNKMQILYGLNQYYAKSGSAAANVYADLVEACIERDQELTAYYNNTMSGGYWKGMMSSAHVGYVAWNSDGWSYPEPDYVQPVSGSKLLVDVDGAAKAVDSGTLTLPDFTDKGQKCYALTISNGGDAQLSYTIAADKDWIRVTAGEGALYAAKTLEVSVDWSKLTASDTGTITVTSGNQSVEVQVNAKVLDTTGLASKTFVMSNGVISMEASSYSGKGASGDGTTDWKILTGYGKTKDTAKMYPTTNSFTGANGPYLEYTVQIPEDGEYTLTTFVGPSNNLHADTRLQYGVSIDDGTVTVQDSLPGNYISGSGNAWSASVMNMGRTAATKHTLTAGVHTIRIYGVDAGLQLEKLVLSKEALSTSYMGPQESWYVGKATEQQPLVHYQLEDTMFLPGTIMAKDCENDGVTATNGALDAEANVTYTYPVNVTTAGKFLFSVTGAGSGTATIKIGGKSLRYELGETEDTVENETDIELDTGSYVLELTVDAASQIRSIMGEIYDDTPGLAMTVSSIGGDGENAIKAADRKNSSAWKPTDINPTITLHLSEPAYADSFTLSGDFAAGTTVTLTVDDEQVYTGTADGAKVYFHGHTAFSGSDWKFSFSGTVHQLAEIKLNTYINWALKDEKTAVAVDLTGGSPDAMIDGDRIGAHSNDGWIAQSANGKSATITFGVARTLTGVNILGLNRVQGTNEFLVNVIPDEMTESDTVSNSYTVSYQDASGNWHQAAVHSPNGKVLSKLVFDEPVTAKAIKVTVSTSYWIRLTEIEPIQAVSYTVNGIARAEMNWALAGNGGSISSNLAPSDNGNIAKLNDGIRVSDESNSTRVRFARNGSAEDLFIEVDVSEPISLQKITIVSQQDASAGAGVEPSEDMKNGFPVAPVTIEYFNGYEWKTAGSLTGDGSYKTSSVLRSFSPDETVIASKFRLHYDSSFTTDYVRLIELEVYGTPADMPEVELPEEPDPTDGLTNLARSATITVSNGEGTTEGAAITKLNDGVITSSSGNRWRTDSLPAWVIVDFGGEKNISIVDVISQLASDGEPTLTAETTLGLKNIEVYALQDDDWGLLATGDKNNTLVWQRFELENSVATSQIKICVPSGATKDGWARLIEIQVWGEDADTTTQSLFFEEEQLTDTDEISLTGTEEIPAQTEPLEDSAEADEAEEDLTIGTAAPALEAAPEENIGLPQEDETESDAEESSDDSVQQERTEPQGEAVPPAETAAEIPDQTTE